MSHMFQKLEEVEKRYEELNKLISDPEVISNQSEWQKLMKEHGGMQDIVEKYREYKKVKNSLEEAKEMLNDPELKELAGLELEEAKEKCRGRLLTNVFETNPAVLFTSPYKCLT